MLDQIVNNRWVSKCRGITKLIVLVSGNLAQYSAHDFADLVLGNPGAHCTRSGDAIGPISLRTHLPLNS